MGEGTVDAVVMIFVLSALSPAEWEQAIENVYRVCHFFIHLFSFGIHPIGSSIVLVPSFRFDSLLTNCAPLKDAQAKRNRALA